MTKDFRRRMRDCIQAKEESRRRAGRPPRDRAVVERECERQLRQADEWTRYGLGLILAAGYASEWDLSDTDHAWEALEFFASVVLEDHENAQPNLQLWLAGAIQSARRDPQKLLAELGIVRSQGRQRAGNETARRLWGQVLVDLEDRMSRGEAIEFIRDTLAKEGLELPVSDQTLVEWSDSAARWQADRPQAEWDGGT
jgi:hypothetical protein